jgi:hypothetical protein
MALNEPFRIHCAWPTDADDADSRCGRGCLHCATDLLLLPAGSKAVSRPLTGSFFLKKEEGGFPDEPWSSLGNEDLKLRLDAEGTRT